MFLLLNIFFSVTGLLASLYLAGALSASGFVIYNSWKLVFPILIKISTFNLQILLLRSAREGLFRFDFRGLKELGSSAYSRVIITSVGVGAALWFFNPQLTELFGEHLFLVICLIPLAVFQVFCLSGATFLAKPFLYWMVGGTWVLFVFLVFVIDSSISFALIGYALLVFLVLIALNFASRGDYSARAIKAGEGREHLNYWARDSIVGAGELSAVLLWVQLLRFSEASYASIAAFDLGFSIIYSIGTLVTSYFGYVFFRKNSSVDYIIKIRRIFIFLILACMLIGCVFLDSPGVLFVFDWLNIDHLYYPGLFRAILICEGFRVIGMLFFNELLQQRRVKYMVISLLLHPVVISSGAVIFTYSLSGLVYIGALFYFLKVLFNVRIVRRLGSSLA